MLFCLPAFRVGQGAPLFSVALAEEEKAAHKNIGQDKSSDNRKSHSRPQNQS